MAFARLEGLPDVRADFGYGQICATLANVHRREGQEGFSAADFMPSLRGNVDRADPTELDGHPQRQASLAQPTDVQVHSRMIAALLGRKE